MYWKAVGPHRFKQNNVVLFGGKYIYNNGIESKKYQFICEKLIDKLLKNMWMIISLIVLSHAIIVVGPLYAYLFENIRITPFGTNLPFFEKDSNAEITVNMILQTILTFYALIGCIAIEIGLCLVNNTIDAIPEILRFNLTEFSEDLKAKGKRFESIARLRNVFIQIQEPISMSLTLLFLVMNF